MADIKSFEDIFNSDEFELLNIENEVDIYTLKNVQKIDKRADADFVAKREIIENFSEFEQLFKNCQEDLKLGLRKLIPSVEKDLKIGTFCVLDGVLLYIAEIQDGYRGNSGKINRRTTLIFENGTKSNMLLRSLGKRLKDNGSMVTNLECEQSNLFDITEEDTQNGYIYILKSLSKKDEIATKKNLFKIGFSTTSVETRIKNAKVDATYLMDEVKIVSAFEVYNVNPFKLEQLIHRFFANSCLDIEIFDDSGKANKPREWFIVPLEIIEKAINLIINGQIIYYQYDEKDEEIKLKT